MGFLKKLFGARASIQQLPAGSMTLDRDGRILTSTVASTYPTSLLQAIGRDVLQLFQEARTTQMPFVELDIHFASLRITARELRGGVIVFLFPQTSHTSTPIKK
ncbi:MAG TPA: hypothetical protein VHG89_13865 [Verrucomicrobiae bacterium]|nr:hypothetical protein [Verrucomicrobiae bacterium]